MIEKLDLDKIPACILIYVCAFNKISSVGIFHFEFFFLFTTMIINALSFLIHENPFLNEHFLKLNLLVK
jgi:hypothetical protein